jgi:hypothetical protein
MKPTGDKDGRPQGGNVISRLENLRRGLRAHPELQEVARAAGWPEQEIRELSGPAYQPPFGCGEGERGEGI